MCCVTEINLKLEPEQMDAKDLELMMDVLTKAAGFELDSRKTMNRLAFFHVIRDHFVALLDIF